MFTVKSEQSGDCVVFLRCLHSPLAYAREVKWKIVIKINRIKIVKIKIDLLDTTQNGSCKYIHWQVAIEIVFISPTEHTMFYLKEMI